MPHQVTLSNPPRNLKLVIEYDGTRYAGWQIQGHKVTRSQGRKSTIQETIEKTLQKIVQEKIRLIASGRTDAGVHALGQVANFKTYSVIPSRKLQKALNSLLPGDIVITKAEEVASDFHSRYAAKSKIYRYLILHRAHPSAFLKERVYFYRYPLNVQLMRREAGAIIGKHDFRSFCASGSGAKSTIRTIKRISIQEACHTPYAIRHKLIVITIEANGFLYNMVRNIIGTLLEIGRGRLPPGSLRSILKAKDRTKAGPTASACGLYLLQVKY